MTQQQPLVYYTDPYHPFGQRAVIVAAEKGATLDQRSLRELPERYRRFNLSGHQPPVLVVPGDTPVQLMMLICEYLDETLPGPQLHPRDPTRRAIHSYYCEIGTWLLTTLGDMHRARTDQAFAHNAQLVRQMLATLEDAIAPGPYFTGEDFSFVDIWFGPVQPYLQVYREHAGIDFLADTPRLRAYLDAVVQRDSIAGALPADARQRILASIRAHDSVLARAIATREA